MTRHESAFPALARVMNQPLYARGIRRYPAEWDALFLTAATLRDGVAKWPGYTSRFGFGDMAAIETVYRLSQWYAALSFSDRAAVERMIGSENE